MALHRPRSGSRISWLLVYVGGALALAGLLAMHGLGATHDAAASAPMDAHDSKAAAIGSASVQRVAAAQRSSPSVGTGMAATTSMLGTVSLGPLDSAAAHGAAGACFAVLGTSLLLVVMTCMGWRLRRSTPGGLRYEDPFDPGHGAWARSRTLHLELCICRT